LRDEVPGLPLIVARPSIVVGHSLYGRGVSSSIFWVFRMARLLEKFTCDLDQHIDVVPVDYCAKALPLYGGFAALNYVFDNRRLLAENIPAPPSFCSYVDACVRTSEHIAIVDRMLDDLK